MAEKASGGNFGRRAKSKNGTAPGPAERKPWDRHPWPERGDDKPHEIWTSVGYALTRWEELEWMLARMFDTLVESPPNNVAAIRAYGAVRTFEGRHAMLRQAAQAFFMKYEAPTIEKDFNRLLGSTLQFAARRNDIAHGLVAGTLVAEHTGQNILPGWVLYPSHANTKDKNKMNAPLYAYTYAGINRYAADFLALYKEANAVHTRIVQMLHPDYEYPENAPDEGEGEDGGDSEDIAS